MPFGFEVCAAVSLEENKFQDSQGFSFIPFSVNEITVTFSFKESWCSFGYWVHRYRKYIVFWVMVAPQMSNAAQWHSMFPSKWFESSQNLDWDFHLSNKESSTRKKYFFFSAEVYRCRNTLYDTFQLFRVFPRIYEALEGYNVQMLLTVDPFILPPSRFALVTG